jgi:hypothetical protein
MAKMLAYCGLRCDTCPICLATREKDEDRKYDMRVAIARQCNNKYGLKLEAEDISDCDGCQAVQGKLFAGCYNCEIRKCVMHRNLTTCAYCNDFNCEKLQKHFCFDPESLYRLSELRENKL